MAGTDDLRFFVFFFFFTMKYNINDSVILCPMSWPRSQV